MINCVFVNAVVAIRDAFTRKIERKVSKQKTPQLSCLFIVSKVDFFRLQKPALVLLAYQQQSRSAANQSLDFAYLSL